MNLGTMLDFAVERYPNHIALIQDQKSLYLFTIIQRSRKSSCFSAALRYSKAGSCSCNFKEPN
ncbi:hypothetical protein [Priestia megaterium]|uniref:hypothetical protein n=1 Tax=Priestia megaterium TaxID=1404 RepID=UPI0026B41EFC|nr:hypothetical protein [Priestia megaterium]